MTTTGTPDPTPRPTIRPTPDPTPALTREADTARATHQPRERSTPSIGDVASVGDAVRDIASERVGRVMGREGPYVQLRPLAGGREWDAEPGDLRPMSQSELLSALLTELNARSRRTL
ncbi:hypothetical protein [Streptomyces sparsus]